MLKKGLVVLCCIILIIAALFMAGPRVKIDTTIHPFTPPDDPETWLAEQEAGIDELIFGAEKKIIWAGKKGEKTKLSLVYIHGYSACRQETAPVLDKVAKDLGANLFYTRLTGHGSTGEALAEATVNNWLNDTVQAFKIGQQIGHRVVMTGTSTGGTLVTWFAGYAQNHDEVKGLKGSVVLSPNFMPADPTAVLLTWPWGGLMAEIAIGRERKWEAENPRHDKFWTNSYPTRALLPMMGLVTHVGDLPLEEITTPFLIIYSPEDKVVSAQATRAAFKRLGSPHKKLIPFGASKDPSQHILAGDILSSETTEEVAQMIRDFIMSS